MDWPNKRFKIFTTVLGWPVALFEALGPFGFSRSERCPVTRTILDDIRLALTSAWITARVRPFVAFSRWFILIFQTLAWLSTGILLVAVWLYASLSGSKISLSWMALFWVSLPGVQGVTCYTCCDQISGCTGGDACPLLTTVTANAAAIVATGVAAIDRPAA